MADRELTVLFMPESAYGPTNNCIGIGDVLRRRGHRVVFAAEASWKGRLAPLGFEEALVDLAPPPEEGGAEQDAGQFWKDYIAEISPQFRKTTSEQLETVVKPIYEELISGVRYAEPQLRRIIAEVRPDVVVEDNVVLFPALATADAPFVRMLSCNPLEMPGPDVPPPFSGLATGERRAATAFHAEFERTHGAMWADFNAYVQEQGAPALPHMRFMPEGDLNLYLYPEVADYTDRRPLGDGWHRLDSSVRRTGGPAELPDHIAKGEGSLIYFSLGSLGSADVDLMRRVIDVLGGTSHRYIVSKGPRHDEIELPPNMWGEEFLSQTEILPLVDLVITHGGNNTVTESFHFGKPMIVLPLFWDQYDNAQRVQELGFGLRMDAYGFRPDELRAGVESLLGNVGLRRHLDEIGAAIREREGVVRAADLIQSAAR
ncbi:MGT family glycosyltransferase [Spinactinospora alkalitolerans]|uniref:MGT family glycosyltransferase n=1 Tax=Spinactinospora alkalitolerans TaxID=687207 RepID=A0A852TS86_9ACTN|nr:nucleotide disphospho-sugar-binding domain-containing protein [Spinactinospora alkalitolerans]NYE45024.1 MGT family glycosyltransferase [Spinactinospora alkalitolerans]